MIRFGTFASFALCAGLGMALFMTKYEVQSVDAGLVGLDRQIAADQDQIHLLTAELSFLTQPSRLDQLQQRHLALLPLTAAQLGSFDTLPLKADRPAIAKDGDVPVEAVLAAMQVAQREPAHAAHPVGGATVRVRATE
jgi:hypothetical protein